jgi:hypothetical protein
MTNSKQRQEEIRRLAYEIFERRGRVHGRDLDDRLEAERIVTEGDTEQKKRKQGAELTDKKEPKARKPRKPRSITATATGKKPATKKKAIE